MKDHTILVHMIEELDIHGKKVMVRIRKLEIVKEDDFARIMYS